MPNAEPLADPRDDIGAFGGLMREMRACKEARTCPMLTSPAYYFEPNPATTPEWRAAGLYTGPIDRRVAFVAESPGKQFASVNQPAPSTCWNKTPQDERFRRLREQYGFLNCYLTNSIKCGVRSGGRHTDAEMGTCRGFLVRELNLIRPCLILAVGGNAFRTLAEDVLPLLDFPAQIFRITHYSARRDVWARWHREFADVNSILGRVSGRGARAD